MTTPSTTSPSEQSPAPALSPAQPSPRPIYSVLVANRGEIARRVHHTARRHGLRTVAVYSDADAGAPHVTEADAAVRLPGLTPAETYLRGDLVLAAAQAAGADAVHPGYGFLSENADFARAVQDAGLVWIGPDPGAIDAMGDKIAAKQRMAAAGVPMLTDLDPDEIRAIHLPVLVKASAGGGGRGMRVVRDLADLPGEIEAARREAASAFGSDAVFCERYLERGRHIEVQVMADRAGTVWAVGERECSIQRRHQKVLEEAPSPLVERTPGMREKLYEAARAAAAAIDYTGAGTIEFLATDAGEFFFLEMNTRLQVEHPVTEATTGLDLVGLQFDVAAGRPLPGPQPPAATGWSIEARLYAEDPAHDYRPSSGTLRALEIPGVATRFEGPHRPGIRLDAGVEPAGAGAEIGVDYDAMIAKVISAAPTREQACRMLATALRRARIHGLVTNRPLLVRVLEHPGFVAGEISTAFLDDHGLDSLAAPLASEDAVRVAALVAAVVAGTAEAAGSPVAGIPAGFRSVGRATQTRTYRLAGDTTAGEDGQWTAEYARDREGLHAGGELAGRVRILEVGAGGAVAEVDGVRTGFSVAFAEPAADGSRAVDVDSATGPVALVEAPRYPDPSATVAAGSMLAPMPGAIVRVAVAVGDEVAAGAPLLVVEAMKMEHTIAADVDGTVVDLPVTVGDRVDAGDVLVVLGDGPDDDDGSSDGADATSVENP